MNNHLPPNPGTDTLMMRRALQLACLGAGHTATNPQVGAVLAYGSRILGEGYHQVYGGPHAEVNALASVPGPLRHLIPASTLYVSLEPCNFFGKTPPCTQLILREKIPRVVVAVRDQTPQVAGAGLAALRAAGVIVEEGLLAPSGALVAAPRNVFATQHRPYVILKLALTPAGMVAPGGGNVRYWLTHPWTQRLTHRWRTESAAILVGYRTALVDNPQLQPRLYPGKAPLRIVLDRAAALPSHLHLFSDGSPTWRVVDPAAPFPAPQNEVILQAIPFTPSPLPTLLSQLAQQGYGSLLVEGGPATHAAFLQANLWDEARVLVSRRWLSSGLPAPWPQWPPSRVQSIGPDELLVFHHLANR